MGWFQACRSSSAYQKDKKTNWEPTFEYVKRSRGTTTPRYYSYDNEPCFNLVSGIMQAREDIWQKNSIRTLTANSIRLQSELEEDRQENRRNRAMIESLCRLLVKNNMLPTADALDLTASEDSLIRIGTMSRQQSRREGELRAGQQNIIRHGEASPASLLSSNDGPMLEI